MAANLGANVTGSDSGRLLTAWVCPPRLQRLVGNMDEQGHVGLTRQPMLGGIKRLSVRYNEEGCRAINANHGTT